MFDSKRHAARGRMDFPRLPGAQAALRSPQSVVGKRSHLWAKADWSGSGLVGRTEAAEMELLLTRRKRNGAGFF